MTVLRRGHGRALVIARLVCLMCLLAATACSHTSEHPRGDAMPTLKDDTFLASDGVSLPVSRWHASGDEPRGTVLALHSFGDFRLAFASLAGRLTAEGYEVIAYDQRGFGEAPDKGRWAGERRLVEDAVEIHDLLQAASDKPVYLLGESMGGSVALLVAAEARTRPDGLILAAPGVREGIPFRKGWDVLLWIGERLAPGAGVTLSRDYRGTLSRQAVTRFADDPRVVRRVRLDTYAGLVRLADDATEAAYRVSVPTLVFYGGDDGMVRPEAICGLQRALGGNARIVFDEQGPHLILQAPDFPARAEQMLTWMDQRWVHETGDASLCGQEAASAS